MAAVGFAPVSATALNERKSILIRFLVMRRLRQEIHGPKYRRLSLFGMISAIIV